MVETAHHFSSNVQQAYVHEQAGSFFMTAQIYVNAASRLTSPVDEIPRLTLLLFALELALKAYLIDTGTSEKSLRQPKVRHDLEELYDLASKAGLLIDPDVVAVIRGYRDDHKNHSFRYGDRNYMDLGDPDRAFRTISTTVGKMGRILKRKL
jgi:hypothetical protein